MVKSDKFYNKELIFTPPKLFDKKMLVFVVLFVAIGSYLLFTSFAATIPLSSYYPNSTRYKAGYYLEGNNYANPQAPSRSVLWFQSTGGGSFKQFNSAPYEQCHWDLLNWTKTTLIYTKTHNQCGTNNNEIVYSPGVSFMPKSLNSSQTWSVSGTSAATYYNQGKIVCTGTNTWNSKVLGWVALTPAQQALHIQNNQSTYWTSGSDPSGCSMGSTTKWQENFYLVASLPITGTTNSDLALKRQVGGNVDSYNATHRWSYDVWFDSWNKLPTK